MKNVGDVVEQEDGTYHEDDCAYKVTYKVVTQVWKAADYEELFKEDEKDIFENDPAYEDE